MANGTRTIEAARVTCNVVELLQERGTAGITEIADELDRSKSSVHAYLTTLVEEQYVVRRDGQYALSLRYLDLAEHVKRQVGNYDVIETEVDKLATGTDEVAQFGTIEQGDLVFLYKSRGESAVETMSSIGSREALHSTALGKAILSNLTDSRVRELVGPGPLERKTDHTITDVDHLLAELQETRERGYAVDDEENVVGLRCVSAPVVLDGGTVIGAVSVSGPSSRVTSDRIESDLEERIKRAANVIQINTTFATGDSSGRTRPRGVVSDFEPRGSSRNGDSRHQSDNQPLELRNATDLSALVEEEWFVIRPAHSGKSLDIDAGSNDAGAYLQQYSWHDADMQKFSFERLSDGTHRIDAVHSGKTLEVENASTFNGANVQQNTWSGGDHQKWRIEPVDDGETFRIVNVNSERVFDVAEQSTSDGAPVVQWRWQEGDNQQFYFSREAPSTADD